MLMASQRPPSATDSALNVQKGEDHALAQVGILGHLSVIEATSWAPFLCASEGPLPSWLAAWMAAARA